MHERRIDIRYSPMGPGRYRKIPRRKKGNQRRKPLGSPVRFPVAVIPFHQLPVHLQALCGKDRGAGERDD